MDHFSIDKHTEIPMHKYLISSRMTANMARLAFAQTSGGALRDRVHLRKDRVLHQAPEKSETGPRGRPQVQGKHLALKEPATGDPPDEVICPDHILVGGRHA
jgi:hypothetical protein